MKTGKDLINEINSTRLLFKEAALWWLGQHSFILKLGEKIIYIDPYLTDKGKRLIPPFLSPEEITNADIVLGTHDHSDHIDRPAWPIIRDASRSAKFAVPELILPLIVSQLDFPCEKLVGFNDLSVKEIYGVKITAIASAHEFLDYNEEKGLYPYLGYMIEYNGITVYHSGDCCIYEGLSQKLKKWRVDIALLPINGRDAVRYSARCIGNMTFQEAADLAGTIKPVLSIPTHYDMFAGNRENPANFTEYVKAKYPELRTEIARYATVLRYSGSK